MQPPRLLTPAKRCLALGAIAGAGALAALACGTSEPAQASCSDGFLWRGHQFFGGSPRLKHPLPPVAGTVTVPWKPCSDGGDSSAPTSTSTRTVYRYRGIPATVMLGDRRSDPTTLFIVHDSLPIIATHPLHRYLYGSAGIPNKRRGTCGATLAVRGRVPDRPVAVGGDQLGIKVPSGATRRFVLDAATRLDGPIVDGVPRLKPGSRVRIDAVRCSRAPLPRAVRIVVQ